MKVLVELIDETFCRIEVAQPLPSERGRGHVAPSVLTLLRVDKLGAIEVRADAREVSRVSWVNAETRLIKSVK